MTLAARILAVLSETPGMTDRELTDALLGPGRPQQPVNQQANKLSKTGSIVRRTRSDGLIGNYLTGDTAAPLGPVLQPSDSSPLAEDTIKQVLKAWLENSGWVVDVRWGKTRGCDVVALRGQDRWLIEVKGLGSSQPMNVNYFLGALGEILQRMDDAAARYSICLPDTKQFQGLWDRLPELAKERLGLTAIFVTASGEVDSAKRGP